MIDVRWVNKLWGIMASYNLKMIKEQEKKQKKGK